MYLNKFKQYITGIICINIIIITFSLLASISYAENKNFEQIQNNKFEVKSDTSIKTKASLFSKTIDKISKGKIVDVQESNLVWSKIGYDTTKNGYVFSSMLKKHYETNPGEITVKYVDKITNEEIIESDVYTGLELKKHSFKAKDIDGYKCTKSTINVRLTEKNNQ